MKEIEIRKIYKECTGQEPGKVMKLPGAGSNRSYYRIFPRISNKDNVTKQMPESIIATIGDNIKENRAFCYLSDFFRSRGCNVPKVLKNDEGIYLQTDHGEVSLMDLINKWKKEPADYEDELRCRLQQSIEELVKIQTVDSYVFEGPLLWGDFSRRQVLWDLNYFKYNFMKPSGVEPDEENLENDFDLLSDKLTKSISQEMTGFMYRDFQSRNIMLEEGQVTLIDFQGGRRGPLVYDVISLLWQAKATFSDELRQEMLDYYVDKLAEVRGEKVRKEVKETISNFMLFRTLQVLGAYGFRGLLERKAHFIESIYGGLNNLKDIIDKGDAELYPELERCCKELISGRDKYAPRDGKPLQVEVYSFSYKRGYPDDWTGNGGGFMFDCRGLHNPGRYEEYKRKTGLDSEVIEFLEDKGEVQNFLEGAYLMVLPSVATYERRNFSNLQVGFGCTGGQHRSVYCAQHMAERIAKEFPNVEVVLRHREQGITEIFNQIK